VSVRCWWLRGATWWQHGVNIVHMYDVNTISTWEHGVIIIPTRHQHVVNMVSTWCQHGVNVVSTCSSPGGSMVSTLSWGQHVATMVTICHQHGLNMMVPPGCQRVSPSCHHRHHRVTIVPPVIIAATLWQWRQQSGDSMGRLARWFATRGLGMVSTCV
jgi:hypothetical protein